MDCHHHLRARARVRGERNATATPLVRPTGRKNSGREIIRVLLFSIPVLTVLFFPRFARGSCATRNVVAVITKSCRCLFFIYYFLFIYIYICMERKWNRCTFSHEDLYVKMRIYVRVYCMYVWEYSFFFSAPSPAKRKEKLTAVINVLRRPFCVGAIVNHLISGRRDSMRKRNVKIFSIGCFDLLRVPARNNI